MDASASYVAVIVDIVGSRNLPDRGGAQRAVLEAFDTANVAWDPVRALYPTVGDEFQALYADIATAVTAVTAAALVLEGVELRCGFGRGEVVDVDGEGITDGSAWWRAREAIDWAHRQQDAGRPDVRSSFADPDGTDTDAVVAFLSLRDHVIGRMKARERRIAALTLLGMTQGEIARRESITQSAVSQSMHRSGARALTEALAALAGEDGR